MRECPPVRPRGFCAGVRRAVGTVERALDTHRAPVRVRTEIVHDHHAASGNGRGRGRGSLGG
ncbi:hypothetical protein [Streptomyces qinglanensis]|uniref:hypothetical protein n=1 Tax=Streptomyces qinglanensis TaxID=943816 RepID=UPI003D758EB4